MLNDLVATIPGAGAGGLLCDCGTVAKLRWQWKQRIVFTRHWSISAGGGNLHRPSTKSNAESHCNHRTHANANTNPAMRTHI
jgi:hypothetical protein